MSALGQHLRTVNNYGEEGEARLECMNVTKGNKETILTKLLWGMGSFFEIAILLQFTELIRDRCQKC